MRGGERVAFGLVQARQLLDRQRVLACGQQRFAQLSDRACGRRALHLTGERIGRAINLGAIDARTHRWVRTRISLERR